MSRRVRHTKSNVRPTEPHDVSAQGNSQAENDIIPASQSPIASADVAEAAKNMVRYLLNVMGSKNPVRRSELVKHTLLNSSRQFEAVRKEAQKMLQLVYGLELHEVSNSSSNKQYIVVNTNKCILPPRPAEMRSEKALLLLVLAHIFMSGGAATEISIFGFLKKVKIITDDDGEHTTHFGNVKHRITIEFPRMLYLMKSDKNTHVGRSLRSEPITPLEWAWGARAEREISKESVLRFVAKVYGRDINTWPSLCKQAGINKRPNDGGESRPPERPSCSPCDN